MRAPPAIALKWLQDNYEKQGFNSKRLRMNTGLTPIDLQAGQRTSVPQWDSYASTIAMNIDEPIAK